MANYRKSTNSDQGAGELRHRVTFLHKQVTVQKGITKETWIPALTCWANALLTSDTAAGVEYGTPKPLVGAISAKISPSANQEKLWADDGVFDIANNLGDISVELELATLPLQAQATLLGHTYLDGVMTMKATDEPPYLAIGFMSQPSPGRFRFVWLYKGKFSLIQDEYATATDAAAWRQPKLTGTFVRRDYDGEWQVIADSGDAGFTGADFWFQAVYPNTPPEEPEP